jgi:hypothetical protein
VLTTARLPPSPQVRSAGLSITLPTSEVAVAIIARERMKPNFGNAGSVDNALTRAKERMQSRLTKTLAAERAAADLGEAPPGGTRVNQSLLLPEDFDKNPADFSKVRHVAARPTRIGMQVLTAAPQPLPYRCAWRSTTWSTSISSTSTLMSSRRASALLRRYVRLRLRAIACVYLCLICL